MTTAAETFTPPKALAQIVTAALDNGRSFIVQHGVDSGGSPFVTAKALWTPDGCDVSTEIQMSWHTRQTGTYRLFSAIARGHYRGWHDITAKQALALLAGEHCFYRGDAA